MAKTILFDFDGTIADTIQVGVDTFNQLAREHGFLEITPENAEMLRGKGPRAVMKELSIPLLRVPLVVRSLRRGVRSAIPGLGIRGGMGTAIFALRDMGYRLGIVTSNSEENVRIFLAKNEINCFDFIRAGVGVFGKGLAIKRVMMQEDLHIEEAVFVGDEIRDIEAAKKNKMQVIGVTWGINSREGLRDAKPDFIVDSAEELVALLSP